MIKKQQVNGYLDIEYTSCEFIHITNKDTGDTISIHNSVLKILNKAIKDNKKAGYYKNENPF